ncbi:MAG: hypothetical protein R2821_05415 [Flavobacteriaceae bacterium]|jgi:hypothetical protein|nr:hypothetical protein [Flavobacteriaceae bacterium]MCB0486235.1 hypothetical protein [Flavobacteriaceae bacterium]
MRKLVLALSAVLVLSAFTNSTSNKIVLKDIDGTLLKSYPVIEKIDGEYQVTFTADANTVVTANTVDNITHVYMVENGVSGVNVSHTLTFKSKTIDFAHYFDNNLDVASINVDESSYVRTKPIGHIEE